MAVKATMELLPLDGGGWEGVGNTLGAPGAPTPALPTKGEGARSWLGQIPC